MCVLMLVPLVHGTAAVCTEACISMGLEESVCVCACLFSWYPLTDVTDTHSFPSRLRAPENRSPSASSSTPPPPSPNILFFLTSRYFSPRVPSAHVHAHRASTAAQQDHTSLKPNICSLEGPSRSCLQERHLTSRKMSVRTCRELVRVGPHRECVRVCARART